MARPFRKQGGRALRFYILVFLASLTSAQTIPAETDRLASVGKLWITVNYFHPALASRNIDWDHALIEALPKIRSAQTPAEYESAVRSMMRTLDVSAPPSIENSRRVVIHHGLAPESATQPTPFYSAFLYKPGTAVEEVSVPMGSFNITVPLSEPAPASLSFVPSPQVAHNDPAPYPSTENRILAAYKIWGALHYFFAYRDLLDEDWDALFTQFLPRLISAKDALEYNLAVAEWLTHAADTFTGPQSATLTQYFGEARVGLRVRIIEKHVTVTEILDPAAAHAGIKIGDIVKKVDGEILVDRFKRQETYVPASTPHRLAADVVDRILNGPEDSTAALTLEDHAGNRKEVTLKRTKNFSEPQHESFKLLRGDIGYADLTRLKMNQVDSMFEKFQQSPAIIFDMRGEPAEDIIPAIAARLANESEVPAAIVTGPIVAVPDLPRGSIASPSSSYFFLETIGSSPQPKFKNKTVMLVDERTINTGERAGLFFEAANKTQFVGTPTAGAHSVLTNFTIPGGITISFSGQDIRHANGGKLQRLGLQPNITVAPTLTGIRTGKDEVLEKALDELLPKAPNLKALPSRASAGVTKP